MNVAALMSKNLFTLDIRKKAIAAKEIMKWAHVRHVPVVDRRSGRLMGMVSHRDLLIASISQFSDLAPAEKNQYLWTVPIANVMQRQLTTIPPTTSIQEAAAMMRKGKYGCLPVVDEHNVLLGLVTEADFLQLVEDIPEQLMESVLAGGAISKN